MKKYLFLMVALLVGVAANAQNAYELKESWQKTVTVPASEAPMIEKLFTAWGTEFPGMYVNAFNKFKETGKAKHIEIYEDAYADFKMVTSCLPSASTTMVKSFQSALWHSMSMTPPKARLAHAQKSSRRYWTSSMMMRTLSSSFPSKAKTSSITTSGPRA